VGKNPAVSSTNFADHLTKIDLDQENPAKWLERWKEILEAPWVHLPRAEWTHLHPGSGWSLADNRRLDLDTIKSASATKVPYQPEFDQLLDGADLTTNAEIRSLSLQVQPDPAQKKNLRWREPISRHRSISPIEERRSRGATGWPLPGHRMPAHPKARQVRHKTRRWKTKQEGNDMFFNVRLQVGVNHRLMFRPLCQVVGIVPTLSANGKR
jgi:hypothetical protein